MSGLWNDSVRGYEDWLLKKGGKYLVADFLFPNNGEKAAHSLSHYSDMEVSPRPTIFILQEAVKDPYGVGEVSVLQ